MTIRLERFGDTVNTRCSNMNVFGLRSLAWLLNKTRFFHYGMIRIITKIQVFTLFKANPTKSFDIYITQKNGQPQSTHSNQCD